MYTSVIITLLVLIIIIGISFFYFTSKPATSTSVTSTASNTQTSGNAVTSVASTSTSTTVTGSTISTSTTTINQNPFNIIMVAAPTNLSQIASLSKFRSCEGHNYSGYDAQGYLEVSRSMKTYIQPKVSYIQKSTVPYFAPANGTIIYMFSENNFGWQVWIASRGTPVIPSFNSFTPGNYPPPNPGSFFTGNWVFVLFHVDPLPGLKSGSLVTAGNLIGYANLSSQHYNFDIAYKIASFNQTSTLDSIFNHMSPQVLSQFARYGINQNNTMFSKAYRDSHPCVCDIGPPSDCYFTQSSKINDTINLTS